MLVANSGNFQMIGSGPVQLIMSFYGAPGQDSTVLNTALVCKAWLANSALEQARNTYRFAIDDQIDARADTLPYESEFPQGLVTAFRANHLPISSLRVLDLGTQANYIVCDPAQMTQDVMRVRDSIGRPGLALRFNVLYSSAAAPTLLTDTIALTTFRFSLAPTASPVSMWGNYNVHWVSNGSLNRHDLYARIRVINEPLGIPSGQGWLHPKTVEGLLTGRYPGISILNSPSNSLINRRINHHERRQSLRRNESYQALKVLLVATVVGGLASLLPLLAPR